jgi:hypothetical protein
MNAIHIIMATSVSANPHNSPNQHIESIIRKRKLSAITFLGLFDFNFFVVRVILFYFSFWNSSYYCWFFISFIWKSKIFCFIHCFRVCIYKQLIDEIFLYFSSIIGILFAFMYWISAEKILIALRKYNADRMRVKLNWIFLSI